MPKGGENTHDDDATVSKCLSKNNSQYTVVTNRGKVQRALGEVKILTVKGTNDALSFGGQDRHPTDKIDRHKD